MSPAEKLFTTSLLNSYDFQSESSLSELYSGLLETIEPNFIAFIKLEYFRNVKGIVDRYQDIPERYFNTYDDNASSITTSESRIFISHKWQTQEHPDPTRKTLNELLRLTQYFNDETGIWWDFCCLPQRNPQNNLEDRTIEQKAFFKFQLPLISHIILESRQMILWKEDGLYSGWCCIENIISNVLMQDLNKTINGGKSVKYENGFLTSNIQGKVLSELKDKLERIITNDIAYNNYNQIMNWFRQKLNFTESTTLEVDFYNKISKELILEMITEFKLTFTNGSDKDFVANLLFKIFQRLGDKTINTTQLSGTNNFFYLRHYIRGTYGNCVMPSFAYDF